MDKPIFERFTRVWHQTSMGTMPDQLTIFIDRLDAMKRDAMGGTLLIDIMKEIMIVRGKTEQVERQFDQRLSRMVEEGQFKTAPSKLRIPADTIE